MNIRNQDKTIIMIIIVTTAICLLFFFGSKVDYLARNIPVWSPIHFVHEQESIFTHCVDYVVSYYATQASLFHSMVQKSSTNSPPSWRRPRNA